MLDKDKLKQRVFERLNINEENPKQDLLPYLFQVVDEISIKNAILVLEEYEKMKQENQQ